MLNTGPWNRLPLTVQWLKQNYARPFPADKQPPMHMPITYGPIKTAKSKKMNTEETSDVMKPTCYFCKIQEEVRVNNLSYLSLIFKNEAQCFAFFFRC